MPKTLVLQSHTHPLPNNWLIRCIESVKNWCKLNNYYYRFINDELFDYVSASLLEKTKVQRVIATDLARIKAIQAYLEQDFETVIWCDADFLIFSAANFAVPSENYALGREVWIQKNRDNPEMHTVHVKVHNAFLMFRKNNVFLNFYVDTAERLLTQNMGPMPPQFIGPKLLTAIHNVAQCPVLETAGMLSPLVIRDIARADGPAVELFRQRSPQPIAAANLCCSLYTKGEISPITLDACIDRLLDQRAV
jgi:hypothetical protein